MDCRAAPPRRVPLRLGPTHPHWPERWRHLHEPPSTVTVTGRSEALTGRCLAIVGTRAATPRGLAIAESFAAALAGFGWTIVSGLARGIDAAAHRATIAAGGRTVAVMGTGWDLTFPPRHAALRQRIERDGCCVTELPDGAPPLKHHFPRRNRLIVGLVEGVVVVEAPERSGALITAWLAQDFGIEVFAVPGPIDRPESRGCHILLREGCELCEGPDDVHRVLAPPALAPAAAEAPLLPVPGSSARWIWDRLDLEGTPQAELRARWPWGEGPWAEGLLALEMAGLIRRLPGDVLARRFWRP